MATKVYIKPSMDLVIPGEDFKIAVFVEPAAGVMAAGVQFQLTFDSAIIAVDSIEEGPFLGSSGKPTFFVAGQIDNEEGSTHSTYGAILGRGAYAAEAGVFAVIHCHAIGIIGACVLELVDVIVGSVEGTAIPLEGLASVTIHCAHAYDVNLDGEIDESDLMNLSAAFGTSGAPGFDRADVDGDGKVTVLDLIIVGQHWSIIPV